MGLLRSDIQNEINKAHVKIDELTWLMAKKYNRGHKYNTIAYDVFKAINFIKILELDENLTDSEVSWFIQALRELLSLHEVGYQPTTLAITLNQPAIIAENSLIVSGVPSFLPKYDSLGTAFEDSTLSQAGGSLYFGGSQLFIGDEVQGSPTRLLETKGTESSIDLIIRTSGDTTIQSNLVTVSSPITLSQTLKFNTESTNIDSFSDDSAFTSPTTSQVVSSNAIDARIVSEVATLNSTITSSVKTAGSGLHEISGSFYTGGNVIADSIMALQVGIEFGITSGSSTAGFSVIADTSASFFGPSGTLFSDATTFILGGAPLNYDIDRSGAYTVRSVPDIGYTDGRLGGNEVTALVSSPTATEHDYSVVWDNSLLRYTLRLISTGAGGANDADTLDGLDSTQFLRSDIDATSVGKHTIDLSANASSAGRDAMAFVSSSDNTSITFLGSTDGGSDFDKFRFYNSDTSASANVLANIYTSDVADGTAPLVVTSTTTVANLSAESVGGFIPNVSSNFVDTLVARDGNGYMHAAWIDGITSTTQVDNLNANLLQGNVASNFLKWNTGNTLYYDQIYTDGIEAIFGSPSGLSIYHSGSSYLKLLDNSTLYIVNSSGNSVAAFTSSIAYLYYSNSKKLETTSAGITVTGTATADNFIDSSDSRLKTIISPVTNSDMSRLQHVEPVEYILKKGNKQHQYGVIAQSLKNIYPELVYTQDDGMLSVDYRSLSMVMLAKVQQLEKRVKHLEQI